MANMSINLTPQVYTDFGISGFLPQKLANVLNVLGGAPTGSEEVSVQTIYNVEAFLSSGVNSNNAIDQVKLKDLLGLAFPSGTSALEASGLTLIPVNAAGVAILSSPSNVQNSGPPRGGPKAGGESGPPVSSGNIVMPLSLTVALMVLHDGENTWKQESSGIGQGTLQGLDKIISKGANGTLTIAKNDSIGPSGHTYTNQNFIDAAQTVIDYGTHNGIKGSGDTNNINIFNQFSSNGLGLVWKLDGTKSDDAIQQYLDVFPPVSINNPRRKQRGIFRVA